MISILVKGVIHNGRVEVAEPINLPEGSEVIISCHSNGATMDFPNNDRPMTPSEIAESITAMDKIEPFDMTDEERAIADAWEKKINDYTIENMDRNIKEVFP